MSELVFYFILWWIIGFSIFCALIVNDFYKGREIEVYQIWKSLGYSFLGPIMFIILITYLIERHGGTIQRKRK